MCTRHVLEQPSKIRSHAQAALQPVADALLSLMPLLESRRKEALLPYPRIQGQRQITYRCLIGSYYF